MPCRRRSKSVCSTACGAYTFSKTIDDFQGNGSFGSFAATSVQDNYNIRAKKSVAIFSVPHVLVWAFVWELPVDKGRSLVNGLIGGRNLSSISSLQSGMPLVMGTFQNQTGSLSGGSRPNRVGNGVLRGDQRGIYGWFDRSVFTLPAPFAFGNDSRTELQLLQPGAFNMSAMLQKEFRFSEKRWLEFRCQSGNILNHFNPGGPATTIGAPGVGAITGGSAGRSLQLTLKLHY
jgi:hypothetical protein